MDEVKRSWPDAIIETIGGTLLVIYLAGSIFIDRVQNLRAQAGRDKRRRASGKGA